MRDLFGTGFDCILSSTYLFLSVTLTLLGFLFSRGDVVGIFFGGGAAVKEMKEENVKK